MSSATLNRVHGLQELLDQCRRRMRLYSHLRGFAETLCVAVCSIGLACLADYVFILPAAARLILLCGALGLTAFVAVQRWIVPALSSAPDEELGAAMDLRFPELQESLATLISFDMPDAGHGDTGSRLMQEKLHSYVQKKIRSVEPSQVVESRGAFNRCGVAALSLILILVPLLMWPSGSRLLFERLMTPFANLSAPTDLYFEVPDNNKVVATASDVEFIAIPQWHSGKPGALPDKVVVEVQTSQGQNETLEMHYSESEAQFSAMLADARRSFQYRIRGGRTVTEWFELTVADPPTILSATLTETPPAYVGRPIESFDGIVGDIHVFERSQIEMTLTFSKPIESLVLNWKSWTPIETVEASVKPLTKAEEAALLPEELAAHGAKQGVAASIDVPELLAEIAADRKSASFRFEAIGSGAFEFLVKDDLGLQNPADPSRRLITSADKPPELIVKGLQDELNVRSDDIVPLNCVVTDDIGVGLLEVHYQKNADAVRIESARDFQRGALSVASDFAIAMKSLDAHAGDSITFRVRAADDRPIPGPHVVWKGPWTLRIDDNADPLGKKSLTESDQKLVDALRKLEEELRKDAELGNELKNQAWKEWNLPTQDQIRELSEKEQTQGRELQTLAEQVAEHPLMAKQAEKLSELAQRIRQEVPQKLDEAVRSDRDPAAINLQESVNQLNQIREELRRVTDEVEKIAELEQELSELNRIALDAQKLAQDSEKLEAERKEQPEAGQTEQERQEELDARQRELQDEQQAVEDDLNSLLQRHQELLQAAREAQLNRAADVAKRTRELAQQQQQLAEGVKEEARDAARDAQGLANELQEVRNEVQQLNQKMQQQARDVESPQMQPLDEAIRDLRQGNLASPAEKIQDAQEMLEAAAGQLGKPPEAGAGEDQRKTRAELSEQAKTVAGKLEQVQAKLNKMSKDLAASPDQAAEPGAAAAKAFAEKASAENEPSKDAAAKDAAAAGKESDVEEAVQGSDAAAGKSPAQVGKDLLRQLKQLDQSTRELAQTMQTERGMHDAAKRHAELAAERSGESLRNALAGQFTRAAERMRQAGNESSNAASNLKEEHQQDREAQLEQQGDDFDQMSDLFSQLQNSDSAQVATQQSTQRQAAENASELPEPLQQLSEEFENEALGMQHLSKQLEQASAAAEQAAESSQRASQQLNEAQLEQAGRAAEEAAGQLNRAAQLAEQASEGHRDPNALIPTEVGESVNDAMNSLSKARRLMQKDAAQPGEGKPGEGKPGEGEPGEGKPGEGKPGEGKPGEGSAQADAAAQMAKAAKALQQATRGVMPRRFTPGQLDPEGEGSADSQGFGNTDEFDGKDPEKTTKKGRKKWGTVHDELTEEATDQSREMLDSEYAEFIRRFRRDMARIGQDPPPAKQKQQ